MIAINQIEDQFADGMPGVEYSDEWFFAFGAETSLPTYLNRTDPARTGRVSPTVTTKDAETR